MVSEILSENVEYNLPQRPLPFGETLYHGLHSLDLESIEVSLPSGREVGVTAFWQYWTDLIYQDGMPMWAEEHLRDLRLDQDFLYLISVNQEVFGRNRRAEWSRPGPIYIDKQTHTMLRILNKPHNWSSGVCRIVPSVLVDSIGKELENFWNK